MSNYKSLLIKKFRYDYDNLIVVNDFLFNDEKKLKIFMKLPLDIYLKKLRIYMLNKQLRVHFLHY